MRRGLIVSIALTALLGREVGAAPNPVIASLLSVGSTVIPVGVGTGLLLTGRGADEGIRFDIGLAAIAIGAVAGPSVGQLYGQGGIDALVSFILRAITGAVMIAGIGLELRGDPENRGAGLALAIVGGIPTAALAAYDVWAAADSATEAGYREGHASVEAEAVQLASILACGPIPCGVY
jgi:hypothetical protein